MLRANYVHVTGPESGGIDRFTGDEFPVWCVSLCHASPAGAINDLKHYAGIRSWSKAKSLGAQISRDRGIELVDESGSA